MARIDELKDPTLENQCGLKEINSMLLDIAEPFILVPFEFQRLLPATGCWWSSSNLIGAKRKFGTRTSKELSVHKKCTLNPSLSIPLATRRLRT